MTNKKWLSYFELIGNSFELIGVLLVLGMASILQFVLHELPCPLCLLQRFGFLAIAFGFLLNFRYGYRPSHYAVVIISAVFTSFVALRQIALHVLPGTGVYGMPVFGLHLYTWCFILSMLIVIGTTLLLSFDRQYQLSNKPGKKISDKANIFFILLMVLLVTNIFSVIAECGLTVCPDNPVRYAISE